MTVDRYELSLHLEARWGIQPLVRIVRKGGIDTGWPVLGLHDPDGARALLKGWTGDVAVVTGGTTFVADLDIYKPPYDVVLDQLTDAGFTDDTVTSASGGGGRHRFYRLPSNLYVPSHALAGFANVDIKGHHGLVAIEPSVHPHTGKPYLWLDGLGPDDVGLAIPSAETIALVTGEAHVREPNAQDDERNREMVELLIEHAGAHTPRQQHDGTWRVLRPGKERGNSGTIGYVGPGVFRCFSSSWPPFDYEHCYNRREVLHALGLPDPRALHFGATNTRHDSASTARTLAAMFADPPSEHDWLIPGQLERGDRVLLTGGEGGGKSTLLRQIALASAFGVNSLSTALVPVPFDPFRVLVIDLENSERQLLREVRKALAPIPVDRRDEVLGNVFAVSRAEGLVLSDPRDRDGDRGWLWASVEAVKPDLLIIGPVYKMLEGDSNEESPSRELVKWLDRLRITFGLTLLIEAHTPHDAKRPYGWSGWKRWPEFGIHLTEAGKLEHFRGQREERSWPEQLRRGRSEEWLWTPASGTPTEPFRDPLEELIAQCKVDVLRVVRTLHKPPSRAEIVDRVGRRKAAVVAAITRSERRGRVHRRQRQAGRRARSYLLGRRVHDRPGRTLGSDVNRCPFRHSQPLGGRSSGTAT